MKDCYLNKFVGVLDNSSLEKYGVLTMPVVKGTITDASQQQRLGLKSNAKIKVSVSAGGALGTSLENLGTSPIEIEASTNMTYLYFSNENYNIFIENKYGITAIDNMSSTKQSIIKIRSLKDFSVLIAAERIRIFNPSILSADEDIKYLSKLTELTYLGIAPSTLTGNINSLVKLTKVKTVNFVGSNLTGVVEDFVSGQIANGKTSTPTTNDYIFFAQLLKFATFGGNHYQEDNCHIGWESSSKIFVFTGNSNLASCTTVYCKGYTQQEAEAAFSGKTIVRVDA